MGRRRSPLTQCVTIRLEADPALVPPGLGMALYRSKVFRLRLVPCKGGVMLHRYGHGLGPVHSGPDSLVEELADLALTQSLAMDAAPAGTATHAYRADRFWFYMCARRACWYDARITALWGLDPEPRP